MVHSRHAFGHILALLYRLLATTPHPTPCSHGRNGYGRITFDGFIASLEVTPDTSDAIAIAIKMLGRELSQHDVESDDVVSFALVVLREPSDLIAEIVLIVTLDELRDQEGIKVERVPLIKTLRGVSGPMLRTLPHHPLHGPPLLERTLHNHQSPAISRLRS